MKKTIILAIIIIIAASFIIYEFILPRIPIPLITKDQVVSNQILHLDSFYTGNCTTLAYQESQGTNPIYVNGSSSLLLAYTEMYKITKDQKYLNFAALESNCIQNQINPFDVGRLRLSASPIGSLSADDTLDYYLSDNLFALSEYYSVAGGNPPYLTSIAQFLASSQIENKSAGDYIVSKQKIILALLEYYNISGNQDIVANATSILNTLEQNAVQRTVDMNANFLSIYSSLYRIAPTQNIAKIAQRYANQLVVLQKSDGSFNSDLLHTLRTAEGLDACWQDTGNTYCKQSLNKALSYLAGNLGIGKFGLTIDNTQVTSVGSQLAVLLVKYKDGWTL